MWLSRGRLQGGGHQDGLENGGGDPAVEEEKMSDEEDEIEDESDEKYEYRYIEDYKDGDKVGRGGQSRPMKEDGDEKEDKNDTERD